jgi:hypothetical protein
MPLALVKRNENDAADAEASCEAVKRWTMGSYFAGTAAGKCNDISTTGPPASLIICGVFSGTM